MIFPWFFLLNVLSEIIKRNKNEEKNVCKSVCSITGCVYNCNCIYVFLSVHTYIYIYIYCS